MLAFEKVLLTDSDVAYSESRVHRSRIQAEQGAQPVNVPTSQRQRRESATRRDGRETDSTYGSLPSVYGSPPGPAVLPLNLDNKSDIDGMFGWSRRQRSEHNGYPPESSRFS